MCNRPDPGYLCENETAVTSTFSSLSHFFPECIPFPQSSIFFMMLLIFQDQLATWSTPLRLPFISSIPKRSCDVSTVRWKMWKPTLRWGSAPVRRPWVSLQGEAKGGFSLLFYCPPSRPSCVTSGFVPVSRRVGEIWFAFFSLRSLSRATITRHRLRRTGPHLDALQALIKPPKCNYSSSYFFLKKIFCFLNKYKCTCTQETMWMCQNMGSIAPLQCQQTEILNKRADKSFNLEDLE